MRLYVSLAAALLAGILLLSACNSNELAGRQPSNSQPPAQSSNQPPARSSNQPPMRSSELPPVQFSTPLPTLSPAEITSSGEARRITPAELKDMLAHGQAILIDVRGEAAYNASHIKGSIQIPFAEIAAHADELPRNRLIATYCSWPSEHTSAGAVLSLRTKGLNNAAAVLGGFEALKGAGYEVVTGSQP